MKSWVHYGLALVVAVCLGGCATQEIPSEIPDLQATIELVSNAANGKILTATSPQGVVFAATYDERARVLRFIGNAGDPARAIACLDGPPADGFPEWCRLGAVQQIALAEESATQVYWSGISFLAEQQTR